MLVIAPKRVAEDTWAKETEKWDHLSHLKISKILGDASTRRSAIRQDADIYVVNRENVPWLCEEIGPDWKFDTVIIDELSSFKSPSAKRFKALRRNLGKMNRVIGLTGTPAPKGYIDLWSELYLIDKGERLGRTVTKYRNTFFLPDKMSGHIVYSYRLKDGAREQIDSLLKDICMSLDKETYLSLPGQEYQEYRIDAPEALIRQYRQFKRDRVMEAADESGEVIAANAATLTGKLLQFGNGAIYAETEDGRQTVRHIHDLKLDALEEIVESVREENEPLLVLYAYRHDRDRITERLNKRFGKGTVESLDTPEDITRWNSGKMAVALAHPASVGHGLNLQYGGHIIVWFGLPWSLELYQQANERLNRPGQKHKCIIIHLIMNNMHDEFVLKALRERKKEQSLLLDALKMAEEHNPGDDKM